MLYFENAAPGFVPGWRRLNAIVSAVVVCTIIVVLASSAGAQSAHKERDLSEFDYLNGYQADINLEKLATRDVEDAGEAYHDLSKRVLVNVKAAIFDPTGVTINGKLKKAIPGLNTLIIPITATTDVSLLLNIATATGCKLILQTLSDPIFALNTSIAQATVEVNAAVGLCVSLGPTICLGLQLDIEPHLSAIWASASLSLRQNIIDQLGQVLASIRVCIPTNLHVCLTVPYFYFSTLNLSCVVTQVDSVLVKVFGGVGYTLLEILSLLTAKISSVYPLVQNVSYTVGVGIAELGVVQIAEVVTSALVLALSGDAHFLGTTINSLNLALATPLDLISAIL